MKKYKSFEEFEKEFLPNRHKRKTTEPSQNFDRFFASMKTKNR